VTTAPTTIADYLRQQMDAHSIDSGRELARTIGLNHETTHALLRGHSTPSETTLAKISEAFGTSLPTLRELAGRPPGESRPFELPPEADQLNTRERRLVLELISTLLAAHGEAATRSE
jgi:transcriptional regulator with XRE-family HTH domain